MGKQRRRPLFFSVRHMLMSAFLLLILLPYLVTSVYFTISMRQQLQQETASALSADANLLLRSLDTMLSETQRVAYLHLLDQDLARILQTQHRQYDMDYYADERVMLDAIKHATNLNSNILAVTFFAQHGSTYQVAHIPTQRSEQPISLGPSERFYVGAAQDSGQSNQHMSTLPVMYALYGSLGGDSIGSVRIDYNLIGLLQNAFTQCASGGSFAIVQDGRLIVDTGGLWEGMMPEQLARAQPIRDDVLRMAHSGGEVALLTRTHERTRLQVTAYATLNVSHQPAMRSIGLYLVILALLLLVDLGFSYVISRQIGNSIKELSGAMDNAQHGQNELLVVPVHTLVESEINGLRTSYNAMVNRLAASAQREWVVRMQQKTIALRVLESQINPHFLYNALNLIASLAQLSRQETIRSVAVSLAAILRYAIKGGSLVTLEEELAQTGHYIHIIKLRFPDRIVIREEVDHALLGCQVPKLLLQPLLENACKYATDTQALMVVLAITIRAEADDLLLTVADNGPGIPAEKLAALHARMERVGEDETGMDQQTRSIGLLNVHARVRTRYGSPYGVHIDSTDIGCAVTIRLPRLAYDGTQPDCFDTAEPENASGGSMDM